MKRRGLSNQNLIKVVDDAAVGRVNKVNATVRMIVAIAAHRRTPIRWHFAEFDISGHRSADHNALPDGSPRHLLQRISRRARRIDSISAITLSFIRVSRCVDNAQRDGQF